MSELLNVEGKEYVAAVVAAKRFGYTKDYLLLLIKDGKIDGRKIGNKWYVYVPGAEAFFADAKVRREVRRKQISLERKRELKSHTKVRFRGNQRTAVLETLAIVLIGLSLGVTGYVGIDAQQTASVAGTTSSFFEKVAVSLHTLVYPENIAAPGDAIFPDTTSDASEVSNTGESIIVAPIDSFTEDAVNVVRDSFSDPVFVSVDPENPDTGIIVPEFRDGQGDAYRFLLVPITSNETGMQ